MFTAKLIVVLIASSCLGAPADRPPELTLDKPVDYIGWWKHEFNDGDGENAYELYKPLFPDAKGKGGLPSLSDAAQEEYRKWDHRVWEAKDYPALDAYVQSCEPFVAKIEKLTRVKRCSTPIPPGTPNLISIVMPQLRPARDAAKLLTLRAWRKQDHQADAIIDAARQSLRIADHMQQQPMFIGGLVGIAIRSTAYENILAGLDRGVITGEEIPKAYDMLRENDPGPLDWDRMMTAEWAVCLDTLQWVCANGRVRMDRWGQVGGLVGFDPAEALDLVNKHYGALRKIVDGPVTIEKLQQVRKHDRGGTPRYKANAFTSTLLSSLVRAYALSISIESHRRATMIALALYAQHEKHGAWPDRLRSLDKDLGLEGYRKYGRDPFTGKLFEYKLADGHPLLYTVARDGKDDGGRHDRAWGESEQGGDFVFIPFHE